MPEPVCCNSDVACHDVHETEETAHTDCVPASGAFACTRGVKGKGGDGDPKKPVPGAPSPAGGNRNGSTSVDGTFDESSFTTFGMNVIFQLFGEGGNVLSAWFTHEGEDKNAQVEVLRNGQQNQNDLISSTYIMQWL